MRKTLKAKLEDGFSMAELLVCMLIMVPIMGAAVSLFSVGVNEHSSEQSSVDVNQEARVALEMMAQEIAQAGSHRDRTTALSAAITNPDPDPAKAQSVNVLSSTGMVPGDYVVIDVGNSSETVVLQAVGSGSIKAPFRFQHSSGAVVRLFGFPFVDAVIVPDWVTPDSTCDVQTIGFFGDINTDATGSNSELQYIEYAFTYETDSSMITRSATPISASTKNPALPFVRNVKYGGFTLHTNSMNKVTSVDIALTVRSAWGTGYNHQEVPLFTKVVIPSISAGSILLQDLTSKGGTNKLPPIPPNINSLANPEGTS